MAPRLPKVGDKVNVIEKRNYENGKLSTGVVRRLLSNPREPHPRGNKVELENGTVGRMVSFVDEVGEQSQVDPEEREKYRQEIRSSQNHGNFTQPQKDPNPDRRNFDRERTVSQIKPADIPGEDDLR